MMEHQAEKFFIYDEAYHQPNLEESVEDSELLRDLFQHTSDKLTDACTPQWSDQIASIFYKPI